MQTPYLISKRISSRTNESSTTEAPEIKHRCTYVFNVGDFCLRFYPPKRESEVRKFEARTHVTSDHFYYEDGFMLQYPEPYETNVENKLNLFSKPSIQLDGFFSRIAIENSRLKIDSSAMYLQTLFSFSDENEIVFSNSFSLLKDFLTKNNKSLTVNDNFFANHIFNHSLAYYANAGTPYNEIDFHDSLETIEIDSKLTVITENKFTSLFFEGMERDERMDLLHRKLTHTLAEYCKYVDVPTIGHNLTGGRDSRTSFAIFLESQKANLEIVTGGYNYTHDRVISNFISKKLNIPFRTDEEAATSGKFDYSKVMEFRHDEELFIPLFKKLVIQTDFDDQAFEASGYLGNVITFTGSERNQIIRDNRFKLEPIVQDNLENNYDEILRQLSDVYGDNAHAIFNIKYNTTNKISSLCRRLKKNTFCIFELDFFQYCYFLESKENKKSNSIHYEMMKRSNMELLTMIPFESNKSFETKSNTFELQGFRGASRPRLYKEFLEANLTNVIQHLRDNHSSISFLSKSFFSVLEQYVDQELPVQTANKIFAALGTLEFKGIEFTSHILDKKRLDEKLYTMDFFEGVYLENQIYTNGLSGMTYSPDVIFKTFCQLSSNENLKVVIKNTSTNERLKPTIQKDDVGYLVSFTMNDSGKYLVVLSKQNKETKIVEPLHRTTFVAKLPQSETEAATSTQELKDLAQ